MEHKFCTLIRQAPANAFLVRTQGIRWLKTLETWTYHLPSLPGLQLKQFRILELLQKS